MAIDNYSPIPKALYHPSTVYPGNPYIEALPQQMTPQELWQKFYRYETGVPENVITANDRVSLAHSRLQSMYIPMDFVWDMYRAFYNGIISCYANWNLAEYTRQQNAVGKAIENKSYSYLPDTSTQAQSMAMLGVSGQGKTRCIDKICSLFPPIIQHDDSCNPYVNGEIQIPCIRVQCPQQDTVKGLALQILDEFNRILTPYGDTVSTGYHLNVDMLVAKIAAMCLRYHTGIIVIDEIQNINHFHSKIVNGSTNIIRFLVLLANKTGASICCIGTPEVGPYFDKEDHLRRRTRGPRIKNLEYGKTFRDLSKMMMETVPLLGTGKIPEKTYDVLYEYTAGVIGLMQILIGSAADIIIGQEREEFGPSSIRLAAAKMGMSTNRAKLLYPGKEMTYLMDNDTITVKKESDVVSSIVKAQRGRPRINRSKDDILHIYDVCRERGTLVIAELLQKPWASEIKLNEKEGTTYNGSI